MYSAVREESSMLFIFRKEIISSKLFAHKTMKQRSAEIGRGPKDFLSVSVYCS